MNFANGRDAYRFYAVNGFENADQKEFLYLYTLNELGAFGFMDFIEEISREVRAGVFLSPPPKFVNASENEFLNYMLND